MRYDMQVSMVHVSMMQHHINDAVPFCYQTNKPAGSMSGMSKYNIPQISTVSSQLKTTLGDPITQKENINTPKIQGDSAKNK